MPGTIADEIKTVEALRPQLCANGATNGLDIDRKGYDQAIVTGLVGAKDATTLTSSTFKVQHSSVGGGSGYTDLSVGKWGAISGAVAGENGDVEYGVDLRDAERYMRIVNTVVASGGNASGMGAASVALGQPTEALPA
jgi:hypothetical protein